jgi:hypothetical protein
VPDAPSSPIAARRVRWILPAVVAVWAAGTCGAFWTLALKDRRPLDPAVVAAYFDAGRAAPAAEAWLRARAPLGPAAATVVHVAPEGCSCSPAVNRHLERIEAAYRKRHVAFLRARPDWVAAAPAALVFDAAGRLAYFGPYSDAADCGTSNGFVERALDALLAGRPPSPLRPLGVGCFCVAAARA